MSENFTPEDGTKIEMIKYRCPKHGETVHFIQSHIPGHEGHWCQLCCLEALDKLGVCRVERIK